MPLPEASLLGDEARTDSDFKHYVWLVARSPGGGVCGVSADHPKYGPGFVIAHERAGQRIERYTRAEMRLHFPPVEHRTIKAE
ncbi:hypothetical protein MF271_23160 (plasmid) [Deinococcus sp. KNUC1210]|uniref:hypothetical protein n=1 Tax=Deinococcus sp. KNUC1210 TaxID=2917691 RepID=UPI001EF0B09A|nr:hypothetical protein [Deinococcus sp. KNUC1210]ULH18358.1 hypothetical protein MF271_23160 [Deinococcus sp. KNUC1210]